MVRNKRLILCISLLSLGLCHMAFAQAEEDLSAAAPGTFDPAPITQGVGALDGLLFVGTSQNSSDPAGTLNDVFTVDPVTDASASILSGVGVWGATADIANERILFTRSSGVGFGDELFEVPYAGGAPTSVGLITDVGGAPRRIDGLAISGGVLYGCVADAASNGIYSIDLGTLVATLSGAFADSISGCDADPDTGIIYGVDDTAGQLVTVGTDGTVTNVAAYPAGLTDIDGLAVGGGFAYLVTDESQPISVYDLAAGTYGPDLTSPFANADVFSGGAIAISGGAPPQPVIEVPTMGGTGLLALIALLALASIVLIWRRKASQS